MYNNALFRPIKEDVWGYSTREGKKKIYQADPKEDLYLFDCDFTDTGYGVFKTSWGTYAWFHKDDLELIDGNLGVREDG